MNLKDLGGVSYVPTQSITGTAETVLLVPAAGVMGQYPNPIFPVGSALSVGINPAIPYFGIPFKLRVAGQFNNTGAGNVTFKIYQLNAVTVGTIGTNGSATSTGAPGAVSGSLGDNPFIAPTAGTTPATGNFWYEAICTWDSVSTKLNAMLVSGAINNVLQAAAAQTQVTVVSVAGTSPGPLTGPLGTFTNLNFALSATFATANAANSITVNEFGLSGIL
jgi:hypothetical protein